MNQITPLATDAYNRSMVMAVDENVTIPTSTAFQSFFGRAAGRTLFSPDASLVEIDISRGNEKTALLIKRGTNARPLSGQDNTKTQNYTTISRSYPLIEEEGDIEADQLNRRLRGQNPYDKLTKGQKVQMLAFEHHSEQQKRIVRACERLATQSILDGEMDAIFGTSDANFKYDFYRKATHTFTVSNLWDSGSQDIFADIDSACQLVREDSPGMNPDIMVMGATAMDAFLSDADVLAKSDNRRFELILVSDKDTVPPKFKFLVDGGMIYRGRIVTPAGFALWLFTYIDGYTNSSNAFVNYMPARKVLITSSDARCDRYFGPSEMLPPTSSRDQWIREMFGFDASLGIRPALIKNVNAVVSPAMFYFDAYQSIDNKRLTVRTQAAPIYAPITTDAFVTMTV